LAKVYDKAHPRAQAKSHLKEKPKHD